MTTTNISEQIGNIQSAVQQFGFTATVASNDLVVIRNRKNQNCAHVTASGVEQKYAGSKNLCGALVRNAITSAIKYPPPHPALRGLDLPQRGGPSPDNPGRKANMKSKYRLWGPLTINGQKRWGINEDRAYGRYTAGPHDGYDTRREAVKALRTLRTAEREDSREGIISVASDFYMMSTITLVPSGGEWEVHTGKGKTGTVVRQSGKRWRLEIAQ